MEYPGVVSRDDIANKILSPSSQPVIMAAMVPDNLWVPAFCLALFMMFVSILTFVLQFMSHQNTNIVSFDKREWDVANDITNFCHSISDEVDFLLSLPRKLGTLVHRNAATELLIYKYRLYLLERNYHPDTLTDYCHLHDEEMDVLRRLHDSVKQVAHLYSQIYVFSKMECKLLRRHCVVSAQLLRATGVKRVIEQTADVFCKLYFLNDPENSFPMVSHVYTFVTKKEMTNHDLTYTPNYKRLLGHLQNHNVDSNIKISESPQLDFFSDIPDVAPDKKKLSLHSQFGSQESPNFCGSKTSFGNHGFNHHSNSHNNYRLSECRSSVANDDHETERLFNNVPHDPETVEVTVPTMLVNGSQNPNGETRIPICSAELLLNNTGQCRFSVASNDTTY